MFFLHGELHELHGAVEVDHVVVIEIVALDAEQNPAVADGADEHDRCVFARAERVLVHDDFDAALPVVAEVAGFFRRGPHAAIRADRRAAALRAVPRHHEIALAARRERERRLAVRRSLQLPRQDFLALVADELLLPTSNDWKFAAAVFPIIGTFREHRAPLDSADETAVRRDPFFDPRLPRDFHGAFDGHGLVVRVERGDVDRDLVLRAVNVVLGARLDVVALVRDLDRSAAGDFAARRIGDARLDRVFHVLPAALRCVERELRLAGRVGLQRLAFHFAAAAAPLVLIRIEVAIEPRKIPRLMPPAEIIVLPDDHLDVRVRDGAAEIIIALDFDLDLLAEQERFLSAVLLRRFHRDLEFRQLVFLQPEQLRAADAVRAALVPELDLIRTERHLVRQIAIAPRAAEAVQRRFALLDFRALRIVDFPLDRAARCVRVLAVLVRAREKFPVHLVAGPVRRAVGERINFPLRIFVVAIPPTVAERKRLPVCQLCRREKLVAIHLARQRENREPVRARLLRLRTPDVFAAVVEPLPKRHRAIGNRRAVHRVREPHDRLLARRLDRNRRVRHEDDLARFLAARRRFEQVRARLQLRLHVHRVVAGNVFARVVRDFFHRPNFFFSGDGNLIDVILVRIGQLHVLRQINRVNRKLDALHVPPVYRELDFRIRQEKVPDINAELFVRDVLDLLLRLRPVPRLAFLELVEQPAINLHRRHEILFARRAPVLVRHDAPLRFHPLRVVEKRVVVPFGFLPDLQRRLELVRHAVVVRVPARLPQRHRRQIMRVRLVLVRLRDLHRVLDDLRRDHVSVAAILIIRLRPRRLRHLPNHRQIAPARRLDVRRARPEIQRLLIMRPRRVPVRRPLPHPVRIRQRLLDLRPDQIFFLRPFDVADHHIELLPRIRHLVVCHILRRRRRAPLRIRQPEIHPPRLVLRQLQLLRRRILFIRERERLLRVEFLRLRLELRIIRRLRRAQNKTQRNKNRRCDQKPFHNSSP